jgi:hypothetical protein
LKNTNKKDGRLNKNLFWDVFADLSWHINANSLGNFSVAVNTVLLGNFHTFLNGNFVGNLDRNFGAHWS